MGSLLIPNAEFYAPVFSVRTAGVDHWGYSPIPITLDAIGCTYGSHDSPDALLATFQLWANGADVGAPITIADLGLTFSLLTPLAIPAVNGTNIDTTARYSVHGTGTPLVDDWAYAVLRYTPTNAADIGKQILGMGSDRLLRVVDVGKFSPMLLLGTYAAWYAGDFSSPFALVLEDNKPPGSNPQAAPPAGIVWPVAGTFQDFKLVTRAGGGPGGVYKIALRINKTDVMTITTAATSTRIWTQDGGASPIPIADGDLVDWKLVSAPGTLDADLLYTFTSAGTTATTGYGEGGYGEGGYGGG